MLTIVNFLRGYLEVEISGPFPERFLNICSQNGVSFWQLERTGPDRLMARVRVMEFERLKELAKNAFCEVRTVSKKGAPFFVWRFRKRYLFIAGFLLFASSLYFSSLRIWEIDVVGNVGISDERILSNLEDLGVRIGALTSSIDPEEIENSMILRIPELRWLTVNVYGSRATVEVRERIMPPEVLNEKVPCNIVAGKAGIITKITVLEGKAQAAVGDTVTEGQLLASGVVDTATGARLLHAVARVEARTWYTLTAKMPMYVDLKEHTGKIKKKYALLVANLRINLHFDSSIPYTRCDKIIRKRQLALPGGFILPFSWVTEEYREYDVTNGQIDTETAISILRRNLTDRLEMLVGEGEIVRTDYRLGTGGNIYMMTLTAECIEDIAKESEIPLRMNAGG
jgi:similar to stage IV sporulation protein